MEAPPDGPATRGNILLLRFSGRALLRLCASACETPCSTPLPKQGDGFPNCRAGSFSMPVPAAPGRTMAVSHYGILGALRRALPSPGWPRIKTCRFDERLGVAVRGNGHFLPSQAARIPEKIPWRPGDPETKPAERGCIIPPPPPGSRWASGTPVVEQVLRASHDQNPSLPRF